jgi:hypothetical protein
MDTRNVIDKGIHKVNSGSDKDYSLREITPCSLLGSCRHFERKRYISLKGTKILVSLGLKRQVLPATP